MKKIANYLLIILIVLFIVVLYCLKMVEMGMSLKTAVIFVIMFFAVATVAGLLTMLFTRKTRKKLDNELKSREE